MTLTTPSPAEGNAESLKDAGNEAFKNGEYQKSIDFYTEALLLNPDSRDLKATLYRNRAMVRLKLEDAEGCEQDCTRALEFNGADVKALYRRALAREKLEMIGSAITDARNALHFMPKDKGIIELLQRLVKLNTEKQKTMLGIENKVNEMSTMAFHDEKSDSEQRLTAMNNLLVLARDSESGAIHVWDNGKLVDNVFSMVYNKSVDDEMAIAIIRVLDECIKNSKRALSLVDKIGFPKITRLLIARSNVQFLDACSIILQRIFNALAKMDRTKDIKPDPEVSEANKMPIIKFLLELEDMLTDATVQYQPRETVIDLLSRNLMHMDGGLPRGWSWRFMEDRGLLKLFLLSSQIPEQCTIPVSAETRQHLAICLCRLYDDCVFDTKRAVYRERLDGFFNALMAKVEQDEVKVQVASLLITLLQGPVDVGISLVTSDAVMALMLGMAGSDNKLHQGIAAELIVQAVSKHERATAFLKVGVPVLRKLYDSEDEYVKVRALMGLCKCASAGGDDSSRQTMVEGSTLKLASTCKKFLLATDRYSVDVRRFACEGLSYLSLDADVKEWIVEDPLLLRALLHLAQSAGALCVYTLASIYVNLTNSYEKPKIDEELVKLAQFAKHHVPETHPKDTEEFVERRVRLLVQDGAVSACVAISKTDSKNALELIARAMLAFTEFDDLRGQVLSEGGAKLLLTLTREATPEGQIKAAHAIARLGSQADPTIVFPGQRAYEVVHPLAELLHPDVEGRMNYDALLTLTNLASLSDSVRKRILKERIVPKAEEYWFMTDHAFLRAAAAELLLNLLYCDEFFEDTIRPGTERLKLWVLYCAEDDERLAMASTAGFALLTENESACRRIIEELKSWPDVLKDVCMTENPEVQRRGLIGIANMIESCEKVASEIIASEVFRVLVAITKLPGDERIGSKKEAKRGLEAAVKKGLIAPTDREIFEEQHSISTIKEE